MVTVNDVYVLRVRKEELLYLGKTVSHETFKKTLVDIDTDSLMSLKS